MSMSTATTATGSGESSMAGQVKGKTEVVFEPEYLRSQLHKPKNCNSWNHRKNDITVRKYFKVHRKEVTTQELLLDYFFDQNIHVFEMWKGIEVLGVSVNSIVQRFLNMTEPIDFNVEQLFFSSEPGATEFIQSHVAQIIETIAKTATIDGQPATTATQILGLNPQAFISHTIGTRLFSWLKVLKRIVKKNPADVSEDEYVLNFQQLMNCFGIESNSGRGLRLVIPDIDVHCEPDTLFSPLFPFGSPEYYAPVEAKRMLRDPEFRHYSGILKKDIAPDGNSDDSSSDDEQIPEKRRRTIVPDRTDKACDGVILTDVNNPTAAHDHSFDGSDKTVSENVSFEDDNYPEQGKVKSRSQSAAQNSLQSGSSYLRSPGKKVEFASESSSDKSNKKAEDAVFKCDLSDRTRATVSVFFSQLLGQVVALDRKQPSHGHKRLAIGLVGLRVIFLAFHAKPGVPLADVPRTAGGRTMVHVTRPLSILSAEDRQEIALALLTFGLKMGDFSAK